MNDFVIPPYGAIEEVIEPLSQLLGSRLSLDEEDRQQHGHDVSRHTCQPPQAVVYPQSTEEVAGILKLCHHHRIWVFCKQSPMMQMLGNSITQNRPLPLNGLYDFPLIMN